MAQAGNSMTLTSVYLDPYSLLNYISVPQVFFLRLSLSIHNFNRTGMLNLTKYEVNYENNLNKL